MREVAAEIGPTDRSEYSPHRALTALDKWFREGAIDSGRWRAGLDLRDLLLKRMGRSAGVSGVYGDTRHADPTDKADRAGQRLTGYRIRDDGEIDFDKRKRRASRANERFLEDAVLAACGCHDQEGNKRVDPQLAEMLMRVVLDSESMPTLKALTLERTAYYGAKSKQAPPFSMGMMHTLLGLLALHLGHAK